jgi:hypothetical protein
MTLAFASSMQTMSLTLSKVERKISTSPILERFAETAWSSNRCCSKFCLLSYVTEISERKIAGQAERTSSS